MCPGGPDRDENGANGLNAVSANCSIINCFSWGTFSGVGSYGIAEGLSGIGGLVTSPVMFWCLEASITGSMYSAVLIG